MTKNSGQACQWIAFLQVPATLITHFSSNDIVAPTDMTLHIVFAFIAALFVAILIVPIVRSIAISVGLVDRPDAERKLHSQPIALAGGLARDWRD